MFQVAISVAHRTVDYRTTVDRAWSDLLLTPMLLMSSLETQTPLSWLRGECRVRFLCVPTNYRTRTSLSYFPCPSRQVMASSVFSFNILFLFIIYIYIYTMYIYNVYICECIFNEIIRYVIDIFSLQSANFSVLSIIVWLMFRYSCQAWYIAHVSCSQLCYQQGWVL